MTEAEWLSSTDPAAMLAWRQSPFATGRTPVSGRKLRLFACAVGRLALSRMTCPPVSEPWREHFAGAVSAGERWADGGPANWGNARNVACLADTGLEAAHETVRVHDLSEAAEVAGLLREVVGDPFRPVTLGESYPSGFPEPGLPRGRIYHVRPGWLTPQVLSLAQAAYDERPQLECAKCKGTGKELLPVHEDNVGGTAAGVVGYVPVANSPCPSCRGTPAIEDGTLDTMRLAILADALEEAGCSDAVLLAHLRSVRVKCPNCWGPLAKMNPDCRLCNGKLHVTPGPHVRGCWAIDLILGKE